MGEAVEEIYYTEKLETKTLTGHTDGRTDAKVPTISRFLQAGATKTVLHGSHFVGALSVVCFLHFLSTPMYVCTPSCYYNETCVMLGETFHSQTITFSY